MEVVIIIIRTPLCGDVIVCRFLGFRLEKSE